MAGSVPNSNDQGLFSQIWNNVVNPSHYFFERKKGYWSSPEDEGNLGVFDKLTDRKSQREDWYNVSEYVAEFWCTLSNAGFIIAGLHRKSPVLIFAGAASIVSHAVPKQWLLTIDKVGVLIVIAKLIQEYKVLVTNPILLAPIAALGVINIMDTYLAARVRGKTWPHVVWHISAACVADIALGVANKQRHG
jgi:hypothetical protein